MGDPFKKVRRGEPLQVPAETFNSFIDATRDFKARQRSVAREFQPAFQQAGIVRIKNASGTDRNRFDVLGIDRPIFLPTENLLSFQNQVACVGIVPSEADHYGRFAVLLEPLAVDRIGMACLSGVCPVRLNVLDEEHEFADIEDGCAENLQSGDAGSAFILWKESAEYGDYGGCYGYGSGYSGYGYGYDLLRWAMVRIGNLSDGDSWGTV